jgi:hypothetical protein
MLLAEQPVHQRFVRPGPLVLGSKLLKSPTPTADRDRTVSRRSEPRSRTALMGEQPNPWDLLQPQDATIRHRASIHRSRWRRLYLHPARALARARGRRMIAIVDLLDSSSRNHYLTILIRGWISRYGVMTIARCAFIRLPTVLSSIRPRIGRSSPL